MCCGPSVTGEPRLDLIWGAEIEPSLVHRRSGRFFFFLLFLTLQSTQTWRNEGGSKDCDYTVPDTDTWREISLTSTPVWPAPHTDPESLTWYNGKTSAVHEALIELLWVESIFLQDFHLLTCIFLVKKWKGLNGLAVLFLMKGCETAHIYRRCRPQIENFIYSQGNVELQQGHRKQRTHRQFIDFSPQVLATHKN